MTKFFRNVTAGAVLAASAIGGIHTDALAAGWPANHQGVMLQGFYWDSYTDTKWSTLEGQADELSQYFNLIWIPNSGSCGGGNQMGYMPQYWFTNHNTCFGTEAQLQSMIKTYKNKGTGIIADCVINHRVGTSNWTNFPVEEWNGKTWKIGPEGICCTDEVANQAGQAKPTGARDTGDDFNGARDLDHTNANVQDNCKNYVKCLQEKYGYAGMRYDMVKGYAGKYTKIYNEYANVKYSVGEYWDGQYDAVAGWIDATGKTSAAFDFPGKYAINEAFSSNDMTKLVWKAMGTTDQPAGLIHYGYAQYAVTFVDNHDTYRDGSKFNGNVVAANAFILMSPGTPCVFLPHYKANKSAIQTLINVRNSVGIHNMSAVKVLKSSRDCYMAEVTGVNGKAVVRIGSSSDTPSGYSSSDIKASGTGYCVWSKLGIVGPTPGPDPDDPPVMGDAPAKLYLLGNIKGAQWSTSASPEMTKSGNKFIISATFESTDSKAEYCYFNLSDALGADWDALNMAANRYGSSEEGTVIADNSSAPMKAYLNGVDASGCLSWKVKPGTYTLTADFSTMTVSLGKGTTPDPGPGPEPDDPTVPSVIYVIGEVNGNVWAPDLGVELKKNGSNLIGTIEVKSATGKGYFSFARKLASSWDQLNASGNRLAPETDTELTLNGPAKKFILNPPADTKAFYAENGQYDIVVDWKNLTASLKTPGSSDVEGIAIESAAPVYFNLQGQRVDNPQSGIYIELKAGKTRKVVF